MSWEIENRKLRHIDVCLNENVNYLRRNGFEKYEFIHNALPEISFDDVKSETEFMGKTLAFPLLISGITGGPRLSAMINKNLAIAAERSKVAICVGSQRIAMESPEFMNTFQLREFGLTMPLLANLGAVQLNYGYGIRECKAAVESIKADALVLHLNPLQEVIQNGNTDFSGLLEKIRNICAGLGHPVIVKEVGSGISADVASRLKEAGVYAVDVNGSGGISWAAVESHVTDKPYDKLGQIYREWGIPTADCLQQNKGLGIRMIAGGGIRNGLEMAKAIALGAGCVSVAGPLLKASLESPEKVVEILESLKLELRTAMFLIGVSNIDELKKTNSLVRIR